MSIGEAGMADYGRSFGLLVFVLTTFFLAAADKSLSQTAQVAPPAGTSGGAQVAPPAVTSSGAQVTPPSVASSGAQVPPATGTSSDNPTPYSTHIYPYP